MRTKTIPYCECLFRQNVQTKIYIYISISIYIYIYISMYIYIFIYIFIYKSFIYQYLFYDKVWEMSFCLIWLVHCYYTLSSYYIDLPFMAHSSSSYCIDIPFMVYSTDSSANCAVKCFNFRIRKLSAAACGCSDDLRAVRFDHFASTPETT